jgi:hypothetical protein
MNYRRTLGGVHTKRTLIMLAVAGLLGLSGIMAGGAVPASASDGPWTVSLSASPTTLAPITGVLAVGSALTATANQPVQGSGFDIGIYNVTTGLLAKACNTGAQCSITIGQSTSGTDPYIAYVAEPGPTNPPPDIQAESATSYVTWTTGPFQISLSAPDSFDGQPALATATVTGADIAPTPYYIEIYDETTGQLLNQETGCGIAQTCSVNFTPTPLGDNIVAFVMPASNAYPPPLATIQASSNVAFVQALAG